MSKALIIIDTTLDPLWRDRLGIIGFNNTDESCDSVLIYDVDRLDSRQGFPYVWNLIGWQRWLQNRNIQCLHVYTLSRKALLLMIAASMNRLPCYLHLTGPIHPNKHRLFKVLSRRVKQVICPARYVAQQVQRLGISPSRITTIIPSVGPMRKDPNRQIQMIHRHFIPDSDRGPLLLALESPENYLEMKTTAWAAAIIYHIYPKTRMVVSGICDDKTRNRLDHLQTVWNCPGLIQIADTDYSWGELLCACDILIGGSGSSREVIRLIHANPYNLPLIIPDGPFREIIENRPNTRFIGSAQPRQIATALVECIDEKLATAAAERL